MPPELLNSMLRRGIALAQRGRGMVEPNPLVGCVLWRDGRVIGEGFHAKFGGAHAEPSALADCASRGEGARGATAFVTLEPCCHTDKKTPPCVPALIEAGIARVVIGCLDPNPDVNGNGVRLLRDAGVESVLMEDAIATECRQLIAPFIAITQLKRPYITLKWAETSDRKVAGAGGRPVRITSAASDRVVHELRARFDAIAVGGNTLRADDPRLTARGVANPRLLRRVVFSKSGDLPRSAQVFESTAENPPAEIMSGPSLFESIRDLARGGVTHLLVEPGPRLAQAFFDENLVDRLWVFRSPKSLPESSTVAADIPYQPIEQIKIGDDVLMEYLNPGSDAFFAAVPSADFVLAREGVVHDQHDADQRDR